MTLCRADFVSRLNVAFRENGIASLLTREAGEKFAALTEEMLTENEKFNLTAITDPDKIILNHYVDCAMLCAHLPKGAKVIDVGCGGGFPTLPVAILRPDLTILAIDSTAKKIGYVASCAEKLALPGVHAQVMRAEDGGKDPALRQSFDVATARAVAELRVLCELCLPFVRVGGKMLAMKGKNAAFEIAEAKRAVAVLGAGAPALHDVRLIGCGEEMTHPLVVLDKIRPTPAAYPRPYAQISKKPL